MNKLRPLGVLILTLIPHCDVFASTEWLGKRVVVIRENATLREKPIASARSIDVQLRGKVIEIVGSSGEWLLASGGWIHKSSVIVLTDASEYFTNQIGHSPTAFCFCGRALVRGDAGDHEGAIRDFDEALRIEPGDAIAYYGRGTVRLGLKDYAAAIDDLTESIRLSPTAEAYANRGIARSENGAHDEALHDFDLAIQLRPRTAATFLVRAKEWLLRGRHDQAIRDLDLKQA